MPTLEQRDITMWPFKAPESPEDELVRLEAEYSLLTQVLSTVDGTNAYFIEKQMKLIGRIAVLKSKRPHSLRHG